MMNPKIILLLVVTAFCVTQTGWSQSSEKPPAKQSGGESAGATDSDPAQEATQEPTTDNPAYQKFQTLNQELAQNRNKINQLYATLPIGIVEAQRAQRQEIEKLRLRNAEILAELAQVGLEAIKGGQSLQADVINFMLQMAAAKMTGRDNQVPFDPQGALEICQSIEKSGFNRPTIDMYLYRAHFLAQQFSESRQSLANAAAKGVRVDPNFVKVLDQAIKNWNREQELRTAEQQADDLPRVLLTTEVGDITLELFENEAPNTVANFISLVEKGFYDGLPFFRVFPASIAQTGCPNGNGTGDAGYRIACECYQENARQHFTGTVSMAAPGKDRGSSQFFLSKQPTFTYDGRMTVFGRVIEGMPVVNKIQNVDTTRLDGNAATPTKIVTAKVLRKRDHEYKPETIQPDQASSEGDAGDAGDGKN